MAKSGIVTSVEQLPLVLRKPDIARLLVTSVRTVDRLDRAELLPPPLIDADKGDDGHRTRRWSRQSIIVWIEGGSLRRGRR